jgi:hypothetical protein
MTQAEVLAQAAYMTAEQAKQALADAGACRESRRVTRETNTCTCFCCVFDRLQAGGRA